MENACMHDTGGFLMKIIKIVNNNIVTSLDEQNREIIVMGRGLGFGRKPGMPIEDEKVEKVFPAQFCRGKPEAGGYYPGHPTGTYQGGRSDH